MTLTLAIVGLLLGLIPAAMFLANVPLFVNWRTATQDPPDEAVDVSVLIPARDEANAIRNSVGAVLANTGVGIEVIVLDDASTDGTGDVVRTIADADDRVKLIQGHPLPSGWNGKQHACWQLAAAAKHDRMVFLDADVRLSNDAIAQLVAYQDRHGLELLSAFPHQETGTWLEKWIIPMMHFILLGFLPLSRMRASDHPAYASGCGQLFMTTKAAYATAGTHQAIRGSRHDGLKLPRAYRDAGLMTDVVDGTGLAECRMYTDAGQVVRGVLKNAIEGIANPRLILPFTVILIGGSVLPMVSLAWSIAAGKTLAMVVSIIGVIVGHFPRAIAASKFRQPIAGVIFHAPATALFVVLQWLALLNAIRGKQIAWRGRTET